MQTLTTLESVLLVAGNTEPKAPASMHSVHN